MCYISKASEKRVKNAAHLQLKKNNYFNFAEGK